MERKNRIKGILIAVAAVLAMIAIAGLFIVPKARNKYLDKDGRIAIEPVRIERIRNLQLDGDIIRDIAINAAVSIRDASLKTDNLDNTPQSEGARNEV